MVASVLHPARVLRSCAQSALAFIYPLRCPLCQSDEVVSPGICRECRDELTPAQADQCLRCSAPVGPHLHTSAGCVHCRGESFAFTRVLALGAYEGRLQRACLQAKREASGRIIRALTDLLIERWEETLSSQRADVVIPVPLHWTTRCLRAAAPAEEAAQRLARFLKTPCDPHILRKARRTPPQASLPPTLRRQNLRGAFRLVRGVHVHAVRVLLVDDVLTTGATAHRAASVLKQAGAEVVNVAVLARGIGR